MTKQISQKEAFIDVSRTVLGGKKSKTTKIKIRPFVTDTATVSVKYGLTIPTGDYSSARVDVMIAVPCYVEEMVEVFNDTKELVDKLISKLSDEIQGEE